MIARQRQNLRRTFAFRDAQPLPLAQARRLAETQLELLEATREFHAGLKAIAGAIPPLDEAELAMRAAVTALRERQSDAASAAEEQALAALVRARQNVRKLLSQSNAAASQCRTFDRQERQKLRKPKPEEPKEEESQRIAEIKSQLEQLAEQQRRWSEDVQREPGGRDDPASQDSPPQQAGTPPGPSNPAPSSTTANPSPGGSSHRDSPAELAARQQASQQKAGEIREQLRDSLDAGEAAPDRMTDAAESIRRSGDALEQGRRESAASEASRAAQQLDRLADHLAELNDADFSNKLGHAERMARRLAASEAAAGRAAEGTQVESAEARAASQRELAVEADLLADLVSRLRDEAIDQKREVREALDEAAAANPPAAIAQTMRETAEDLAQGKSQRAAESAALAAGRLGQLADGLKEARSRHAQPRLDDLLAAEEQLSALAAELAREANAGRQRRLLAEADRARGEINALANGDPPLGQALENLDRALRQQRPNGLNASGRPARPATEEGWNQATIHVADGLREVAKVLQTRIQEAVLAKARMDADAEVPPAYKPLVEQYYRRLSDDLQ